MTDQELRELLAKRYEDRSWWFHATLARSGDTVDEGIKCALAAMREIADRCAPKWDYDMEAAPRDKFIFLFCPEDGSRWLAKWQGGCEWYGVDEMGLTRAGGYHKGSDRVTGWRITAWMPLPSAPAQPKEKAP